MKIVVSYTYAHVCRVGLAYFAISTLGIPCGCTVHVLMCIEPEFFSHIVALFI